MNAYVLYPKGSGCLYTASVERGCEETKNFAIQGSKHLKEGGITIVIPPNATKAALLEAAELIQRKLNDQ
jgi:hypothetical protein